MILSVGSIMEECEKAVQHLQEKGYNPGLVNVRFIRPMDEDLLRELAAKYPLIVTVEENELIGGYGQMVSAFLHKNKYHNDLLSLGISDYFVDVYKRQTLDAPKRLILKSFNAIYVAAFSPCLYTSAVSIMRFSTWY